MNLKRPTAAALASAEGLWATADRIRAAAELLERLADGVQNAGHGLLNVWARLCERLER